MTVLIGKRILVVEDEFLVALEAATMLSDAGASVIGPAYRVDRALEFIEREQLDAAMLDVNLGGDPSNCLADRLRSKGVPFIFATGYGQHADVDPSAVVLDKPYTQEQVLAALSQVLGIDRGM